MELMHFILFFLAAYVPLVSHCSIKCVALALLRGRPRPQRVVPALGGGRPDGVHRGPPPRRHGRRAPPEGVDRRCHRGGAGGLPALKGDAQLLRRRRATAEPLECASFPPF
jgi:hypothetical protein